MFTAQQVMEAKGHAFTKMRRLVDYKSLDSPVEVLVATQRQEAT